MSMFGSMLGTIFSGVKSDYLGRKLSIMISQVIYIIGLLFLRFATGVAMLYVGSFLGGYSIAITISAIPMYIGEISQPRIRKFTGSFLVLINNFCFASTYLIGSMLSWRDTVCIVALIPFLGLVLFCFCPESPTWYVMKGEFALGSETLTKLRGDKEVAAIEISKIEGNIYKTKDKTMGMNSSFLKNQLDILRKGTFIRPCLVVSTLMAFCWKWSGGAVLFFYTVDILKKFGIPLSPYLLSTGMGWYLFLCSLLGVFISSIIPRRKYYIGSAVLVLLGSLIMGVSIHLQNYESFSTLAIHYPVIKWSPIIGLMLYQLGYQAGYISVIFMLLGELLPSNARGIGSSIIVQIHNISQFLAVKSAPACEDLLGIDGLFFMFACVTAFSIIFVYFFVPETFGKSLEEIEEHYRKLCNPLNTKSSNASHIKA